MKSDLIQLIQDNGTLDEYRDQMLDLLKNEPEKVKQVPQVIRYFLEKKDLKALRVLEAQIPENSELKDYVFKFDIINSYIKAKYFPNLDKVEIYENYIFLAGAEFIIDEDRKKILKNLSQDPQFSVDIEFSLNPKSIFIYNVREKEDTKKIIKKSSPIITLAVAGAVIFNSFNGCMEKLKDDNWFKKNFTKEISKPQKNSRSHGLFKSFGEGLRELEKLEGSEKAIAKLNELSEKQIEYIVTLSEADQNPLETQEKYRDVAESQLSKLIEDTQEEQILFKNVKKLKTPEEINKIASLILKYSIEWKIDHRIIASIIKQETGFDQGKTNAAGDLSMMQINYPIWSEEFTRLGINLDKNRLKNDVEYGFWAMGIILSMKKKSNKHDPYWFARYHSNTIKRKQQYLSLLEDHFSNFNDSQMEEIKDKLDSVIAELKVLDYQSEKVNYDKIDGMAKKMIQLRYSLETSKIPVKMAAL